MASSLRRAAARLLPLAASSVSRGQAAVSRQLPEAAPAFQFLPSSPEALASLRHFSTLTAAPPTGISKQMQGEIDHATGLEKEELIGEATGKPRFDLAPPQGPFGTLEAPAVIESYFDERLVGCSGGVGDDEHDVVWFRLKKESGHECSVCGQVFQLKVIGDGGAPGGHH
jgi:cytochrome c oxidase subunit 5b